MGLFDRLGGLTQTLLSFEVELRHLKDEQDRIGSDFRVLGSRVQDLAERVTRLEAHRAADRAEWEARFTQFTAEVKQTLAEFETRLPRPRSRSKPRRRKK